MTWSEWGTLIYCNGQRRIDREEQLETCEYHGLAGNGPVRLQWDRAYPSLRVRGERVEVDDVPGFEDWNSNGEGPQEAIGEIECTQLHLKFRPDETTIDFVFVEADGTRWTGSAGYLVPYMQSDDMERDSEQKMLAPSDGYTPPWISE